MKKFFSQLSLALMVGVVSLTAYADEIRIGFINTCLLYTSDAADD